MPEKQTNKERLKDITDSIEKGIQELFQSDKYAQYLRTMSRFHKYSVNNQMLIYMQRPDATLVAGFNKWRDQFERNVMKGEKGIKIIAPTPFKKKIEEQKLDPDTKQPMLDADGKVIMEEKEIKIPMFKPVTVFDVSQTQGKPLPQLASDLTGNVQNYEVFMEAIRRSSPVPIDFKPLDDGSDGFFSLDDQSITIREGMSEVQTVCAVLHEIAHSKLHNNKLHAKLDTSYTFEEAELFGKPALFLDARVEDTAIPEGLFKYELRGSGDDLNLPAALGNSVDTNFMGTIVTSEPIELTNGFAEMDDSFVNFGGNKTIKAFYEELHPEAVQKSRNTEEVEAESISFAVCAYYGIETGENSFGYIANWSKGKELKELRESLETINKSASELITDIDHHYAVIMKEREAEITADAAIEPPVEEAPPMQAPENGYMPDPSMSIEAMNAYGYTDSDMLPLSKERALELFERDVPIYMLYDDNSEAMAFEPEDIQLFSGCFGVSREDWEQIRGEVPPMDAEVVRHKREQAFLENRADTFAIYQLKPDDATTDLRFMNTEWLKKKGIEPQYDDYELVYTGALTYDGSQIDKLEGIYRTFNIDHPADFTGHSLSVSDIVALKQDGVVSCHYVDSVGYKELPTFMKAENYLKTAEMQLEDDYGMIDGIVNNGPRQTELPARKQTEKQADIKSKKPSVLAKLRQYQEEDRKATTMHRSAERGL